MYNIYYILPQNYNFFSTVIISIDNQTRTLKSQLSIKIELLSYFKYIYISTKHQDTNNIILIFL